MKVEINTNFRLSNDVINTAAGTILITPDISENYWTFRVKLHRDQYLLAFPKFFTMGIGFAKESDWNTNLPYNLDAGYIYNHIERNKKYKAITKEMVLEAIELLKPFCESALKSENN